MQSEHATATTTPTPLPHFKKKWMVYNKEDVIEKLNDCLGTILKYFKACYDGNLKIVNSLHTNQYLQTRIQNVHNLLASLMFNDELTYEEYHNWLKTHELIEQEFAKPMVEIQAKERSDKLQKYIDSVMELSIYDDDDDDEDEEEEQEVPVPPADAMEEADAEDENEISDLEEEKIPDTASIINVDNECKKRKL